MKRTFLLLIAILAVVSTASAQNSKTWRERMKAEKIAFISSAMELTPEEAQVFWPIYNKAEAEITQAFTETMKAYGELKKAVDENADDKIINEKLETWIKATQVSKIAETKHLEDYKKVLPASKIAKLFLGEENFRRAQFNKLGAEHRPHGKPQR